MSPCRIDINGRFLPHDDPDIRDDDIILRRVPPGKPALDHENKPRLSSGLFSPSSIPNHGISFDLDRSRQNAGLKPLDDLDSVFGLVYLVVGFVRSAGLVVGSSPTPTNPHHVEVWGKGGAKITKSQKNKLRDNAGIIKLPPSYRNEK